MSLVSTYLVVLLIQGHLTANWLSIKVGSVCSGVLRIEKLYKTTNTWRMPNASPRYKCVLSAIVFTITVSQVVKIIPSSRIQKTYQIEMLSKIKNVWKPDSISPSTICVVGRPKRIIAEIGNLSLLKAVPNGKSEF